METSDDLLFSKESPLLPAAVELAFHTVNCSALNAEELRRENGIEVIQNDLCTYFQANLGIVYASEFTKYRYSWYSLIVSNRWQGFIPCYLSTKIKGRNGGLFHNVNWRVLKSKLVNLILLTK